ncbi:unnamed protein product [Rotaria sp. Silwood2]|nr:unnamed protein product [Rotaria sp. Silwood2]CAF4286242.1 unnamed protein product [Rotaria sp. Silwood2]
MNGLLFHNIQQNSSPFPAILDSTLTANGFSLKTYNNNTSSMYNNIDSLFNTTFDDLTNSSNIVSITNSPTQDITTNHDAQTLKGYKKVYYFFSLFYIPNFFSSILSTKKLPQQKLSEGNAVKKNNKKSFNASKKRIQQDCYCLNQQQQHQLKTHIQVQTILHSFVLTILIIQ